MKKILLVLVTLLLLFIPAVVNAEICENDKVYIDSIIIDSQIGSALEIDEATAKDKTINMNLEMFNVGDNIKYKIVVKNDSNEDYILDNNSVDKSSNYIDYIIESNKDNIVKAKSSKTIYLNVQYKNQVPENAYTNGSFNDEITMKVNLSSKGKIKNPNTGMNYIIIFIISTICLLFLYSYKKKKLSIAIILIINLTLLIPIGVKALCKIDISISSKIKIRETYPCKYEGELVQGAEFTHGDYVYRYMQEGNNENWKNIELDGWGVKAAPGNKTSITSKICTTINDKPIVSAAYMYYNKQTLKTLDLSTFDSSHVTKMNGMFKFCFNLNDIDLSNLNTKNVTDIDDMFHRFGNDVPDLRLDLSSFNTSNVTNMRDVFDSFGMNSNSIILNVSNWDTSKVTNMYGMFKTIGTTKATSVTIQGLSDWDTSKVENMVSMFLNCAKRAKVFKIDLSNWNTSSLNNIGQIFESAGEEAEVWGVGDLSNWDTRKITNFQHAFANAGKDANDWQSIGTINYYGGPISNMFENVKNAKAIINLHKNPEYSYFFDNTFKGAATGDSGNIVVNYSSSTTFVDNIINTKSPNSKVFKGELLD